MASSRVADSEGNGRQAAPLRRRNPGNVECPAALQSRQPESADAVSASKRQTEERCTEPLPRGLPAGLPGRPFGHGRFGAAAPVMQTAALLELLLMFVIVPVWLVAGLGDYLCHRAMHIEHTSGVRESLLHLMQFTLVGVPLLAVLLLEVDSAILLIMFAGLALHQATAVWDVRYANGTRRVPPVEQHIHGILEMIPFAAAAIVTILHWPQFVALVGAGDATFTIGLKRQPLPGWYIAGVMAGVAVLGVLPYGEELLRTVRTAGTTGTKAPAIGS